jgi:formamidopyrimidine-DNA glycosylase
LRELFAGVLVVGEGLSPDATEGRRVRGLRRRGKYILLDLEHELSLGVHLRMTGRLWVAAPDQARPKHTHVVVSLDDGRELRFTDPRRFGRVQLDLATRLETTGFLASLGPEPEELSAGALERVFARRPGPLKGVLLDQRVVAGLGNIYVDEILHDCGLDPRLAAHCVHPAEIVRLLGSTRRILSDAIEAGGSTIRDYVGGDGRPGAFQRAHRVFGRQGKPCPSCGEAVRKIRVAGRGTHFCPSCQPRRRRRPRRSSQGGTR